MLGEPKRTAPRVPDQPTRVTVPACGQSIHSARCRLIAKEDATTMVKSHSALKTERLSSLEHFSTIRSYRDTAVRVSANERARGRRARHLRSDVIG